MDFANKEFCEIGFGGYDECPELWFCIESYDENENERISDCDFTVSLIRMGEFSILHKLEHPEEYISATRDDDDDKSVFHIS